MGGGGMGTVSSIITSEIFPPQDRAFYQGLNFAVFGLGMGLGGPIGGVLTQYFGWRAAFFGKYRGITLASAEQITLMNFSPNTRGSFGYRIGRCGCASRCGARTGFLESLETD
jgi:MFS family permease